MSYCHFIEVKDFIEGKTVVMHSGRGTVTMKWEEFLAWAARVAEIASGSATRTASPIWDEWNARLKAERQAKVEAKKKNKTVAVSIEDLGLGPTSKPVEHGLKRI